MTSTTGTTTRTTTRTTVRDAALEVLRDCGTTRIFANPGSTEVAFLTDLPDDFTFVLALHEGSVVGLATGHAIATGEPAFVVLHTTAGLGNAVGALATARANRAPLVVLVGQQDRRHLGLEPFLAGQLDQLAGPYPVWVGEPAVAQDVPAALRRAHHEALTHRGPAVVIVAMDDWSAPTDPALGLAAATTVLRTGNEVDDVAEELAALVNRARSPLVVVGAGADNAVTWGALEGLVARCRAPVWQEAFGARAGFRQDSPHFAGHLPAARGGLREVLTGHDLVLVVGAAAFRQYPYEPGPLVPDGTRVVVVSDDPAECHRSRADLAVLADPAALCQALAARVRDRTTPADGAVPEHVTPTERPSGGEPMRAAHVLSALAERLPWDAVVVEETPSSRPDLHRLLPARAPRGFVSAAMGGLGFGVPAAAGLRMGDPSRPVVAVLGDGSTVYGVQGLWSAAHYGCGVLYVVLNNGGYAVMDQLAEQAGGTPPWPSFADIDLRATAKSFGCPARRVSTYDELVTILDVVVPTLATRSEPLLLDVVVVPDADFTESPHPTSNGGTP